MKSYQKQKKELYAKIDVEIKPYPVILGPLMNITSCFVVVDEDQIKVDSPHQAIRTCFESFFALKRDYPVESDHVWKFIEVVVYKLDDEQKICKSGQSLWADIKSMLMQVDE